MTTILSPNRYVGRLGGIRVIVLHTMESPEAGSTAEDVAAYFSRTATKASAHMCVDNNSAVRCVPDTDTAWAAPGANADGLQLEMAGRAAQVPAQWADPYSTAMLEVAAAVVRTWCKTWGIPVRYLTDAQLADGRTKGITTHAAVSRVFKRSDHTDPGKNFPAERFLALVNGGATQSEEDEMTPEQAKQLDNASRMAQAASVRTQRIEAALKAFAASLPQATAQAVTDALGDDYDATVTLTPKES